MEIVLAKNEIEKLTARDKVMIEKGEFNKCYFCTEINIFLRDTIFFEIDRRDYCACSGCNKNVNVAFYIEKELSKKEYFRRFIEAPFDKNICNSNVKILNCGVIFINEASLGKELKYFIKQAINPEIMFEGNFKTFNYGGQLDKTLDLTETVKDEEHNIYVLEVYYRVYKTLQNPNRFSI